MRPAEKRVVWGLLCVALVAGVAATLTAFNNEPAEYSVSVAGLYDDGGPDESEAAANAASLTAYFGTPFVPALHSQLTGGLDAAVAAARVATDDFGELVVPALFTLTVHVSNPRRMLSSCVTRGATADVSFRGVKVAGGEVPVVCAARSGGEGEVSVLMWAADLDLAPLLMMLGSELHGDGAVVDVAVRMPRARVGSHGFYSNFNLDCRVTVGGGLSRCKSSWS